MSKSLHVAIVGATGAVGIELIKLLEKRKFPVGKLTLLASARSAGKTLKFAGQEIEVKLDPATLRVIEKKYEDDDDRGGTRNPSPAGTGAPPQNGLFGNGARPQVQVN